MSSSRKEFTRLATEAAKAGAAIEDEFKKKIYAASQTVNELSEKIIAQRAVVRDVQFDVKRLGEAYRTALKNNPFGASGMKAEYDAARKALDEERAALFGLTQEQANARLSVKKLRDEYNLFKEEGGEVNDTIGDITSSMKKWIAGIAGGIGIKEFLGQMIQVRGEFENIETSLKVLLGDQSDKLGEIMSQLKEYALISPLTTKDIASALQMMMGFGIQAEDAITYLKALGDISMGNTVHFNSLALAFSQMSAAGKLMGQDLNQMINAGFNPLQQISEKTGKSMAELKDEMSKGAISAQMVQQAFIDATSEGGKFYGMASEGAKTLNGQISMLQESVDNMFNDMGQASEGVILNSIQAVTKLVENYEKVGKVIAGIIITYGVYRAATIANIVATEGWAAAATKDAVAKGAQTIATKALTVAQSALNSVIKANPYVLLATAIASVATAMWAFHDSAEATLQISNKFGEQASTTITKLNTLTSEVNGLAKGTSLRNKVMNELNGLLEEYGVQAIKEGDSIDSVNEKRKEAIELIKQEAIERDRLNNIDAGQQSYQQKLQDAQSDFLNSLKNARSGNDGAISFLSDNEEIQENAEAISTIIGSVVQENISKIAGKTGEEYEKGLNEIFDTIQDRMRAIGISERTISEVWVGGGLFSQSNIVRDYIEKVQEASEEHDRYTDAVNKAADAEKKAADSSSTYSQRIDMLAKSLQKPNDGVHQLYQNIKNLMSRYSDNTIGFTIRIGGEVPQWMNKKSLPELQKLAKQFSAIGEASKNGAFVNGKYMTQQQLLQRGADYATAAEQKQTEADRKKKELADKKEDSEKKNKNEKAIREQKRAEEQRKKAQETADKDLLALQQKNQDDEIALMQDGTKKKLAEIDNDYKKRVDEIAKQEAEFKKKNQEAGATGLTGGLTQEQSDALKKARENAAKEQERQTAEVYRAEAGAMRDYLKQYGTYQQQKLAIAEEYAEKIKNAQTEGERLSLEAERDRSLQQVEINAIRQNIDWGSVFGDFGAMFKDQLQPTIDQLRQIAGSDTFKQSSLEDQKTLYELIDKLEQSNAVWDSDIFKRVSDDMEAYQQSLLKLIAAQERERAAIANYENARKSLDAARETGDQEKIEAAGKAVESASAEMEAASSDVREFGSQAQKATADLNASSEQARTMFEGLAEGLRGLSSGTIQGVWEGLSRLDTLFNEGDMTKDIGNALAKGLQSLFGKDSSVAKSLSDALGNSGALGAIISAILSIIDQLAEQGIGGIVSGLIDTILGAINGILDNILSGKFIEQIGNSLVDGIGGILNTISFGGFNSLMNIGSNAKEVAENIARLTERNDALIDSLDALRESLDDSVGAQAVEMAKQAMEQQREVNQNYLDIAKNQAGYSGSHHSWNAYWGGFTREQIDRLSEQIGREWSGDLWDLSPEEMKTLKGNVDMWARIQQTGKGGYGSRLTEKLDDYIDQAGALEEIEEQLQESLTQISFDSLYDSFIDTLMDMDSSAEDFADNVSEYFMRAVLSSKVGELFKDRLEGWYDDFANAMEDGSLDEDDLERLRSTYKEIVDEAVAERDRLAEAIGYTGESSKTEQQSASSKGFETMSQDTAEELNGRFTAMYEAELRITDITTEQLAVLKAIYGQMGGNIADVASDGKQILSTSYIQQNNISFPTAQLDALVAKVEGLDAKVADLVSFGADNRLSMQGVDTYIEDATKNSTKSLSLLNDIKRNTQGL